MTTKPKKPKSKTGRTPMYVTHVECNFDLITGYLRAGYTEESTAKAIGISWASWKLFKNRHLAFLTVIKKAKEDTTALVVNKLFQRATGYDYEELQTEIRQTSQGETKLVRKIKKHVVADVGAAIFWLCNRMPEQWKNDKYRGEQDSQPIDGAKQSPDEMLRDMLKRTCPEPIEKQPDDMPAENPPEAAHE